HLLLRLPRAVRRLGRAAPRRPISARPSRRDSSVGAASAPRLLGATPVGAASATAPALLYRVHPCTRPRRDASNCRVVRVTAGGPAAHRPSEDRREYLRVGSARASLRATVLGRAMRISAPDASA